MTTSSHTSSTRSSWWELNTTPTPAAARSRRTSVIVATPSGSRPENGSSRTSSSGSWTSAVASWIRCWLPWDRSSSFDFARSARPKRSSQAAVRALRVAARQPVVLGEVGELLADAHPRVQAALLGHVAEPQPRRRVDRPPVPADLARLGDREPEDAAHRRGLARAVGAEEAEQPAAARRERGAVERRHAARSAWSVPGSRAWSPRHGAARRRRATTITRSVGAAPRHARAPAGERMPAPGRRQRRRVSQYSVVGVGGVENRAFTTHSRPAR